MESKIPKREFIAHDVEDDDAWTCVCGNKPSADGFYPCDDSGDEVSPDIGGKWKDLFVCARCGRIVKLGTLEVVGQNPHWKPLG